MSRARGQIPRNEPMKKWSEIEKELLDIYKDNDDN